MIETIDCAQADQLLSGSLLDALAVDEAIVLAAHLCTCARCRAEMDSLRPAVEALAFVPAAAGEPAPAVKQRLMSQVRASLRPAPSTRRRVFRPIMSLVPIAVALALAIVAGAWAFSLQAQVNTQQAQLARLAQWRTSVQQFMLASNMRAVPVQFHTATASGNGVLYVSDDAVALALQGLPMIADDWVYQCWWTDANNDMLPGSSFKIDASGSGVWIWKRPPEAAYHTMTITVEKQPGATQAEGPVILRAEF